MALGSHSRRKCFISYHREDEHEVQQFVQGFDHDLDVLIARGIGASMSGDIITSNDEDYTKARIREKYLGDTTVTIVKLGKCTWSRKFLDCEVAASLRNTLTASRGGPLAISLPTAADYYDKKLPSRVQGHVDVGDGHARRGKYPASASLIETVYDVRNSRYHRLDNIRPLRSYTAAC